MLDYTAGNVSGAGSELNGSLGSIPVESEKQILFEEIWFAFEFWKTCWLELAWLELDIWFVIELKALFELSAVWVDVKATWLELAWFWLDKPWLDEELKAFLA